LAPLERALAERRSLRSALAMLGPGVLAGRELGRFGDPARLCFNVNDHGAAVRSALCAAVPARSSSSLTSSTDGRSTRASEAKRAIHSSRVTARSLTACRAIVSTV
jgi:hypothetical protein